MLSGNDGTIIDNQLKTGEWPVLTEDGILVFENFEKRFHNLSGAFISLVRFSDF